jgi:chaperonin GroEL
MNNKTKILSFSSDARDKIRKGVNELSSAVQATLGPCGRNVMIEKENGGPSITKDGVSVAKEIYLKDPIENAGAQAIKEVSMRAAKLAGDGTTTATVLASYMYNEGFKAINAGVNPVELKRGMDKASAAVIENLRGISQDVKTNEEIRQVATISANNDSSVGVLIAEAMESVGKNGVIQVDMSRTSDTSLEIVEGLQFPRGFISPYFVSNQSTLTTTLENPLILLCDKKISSIKEIVPLLETCSKQGRALLIIAEDVDGEALATLVVNKARGILNVCAVRAPEYGDQRLQMLEDIATVVGGTVVATQKAMKLEKLTMDMLGTARSVTISASETVIVEGNGNAEAIAQRIEALRGKYDESPSDIEKEQLKKRITKLVGGVAVLNIGAATEIELNEKKDRVEDALQATRAAVEEGIVPGGGMALITASENIKVETENDDQQLGVSIVKKACFAPFKAIVENAGKSAEAVFNKITEKGFGYDARNDKYVDMFEAGIIDPTKVARTALELATSAAGTLLTTECVVSFDPEEKKKDAESAGYAPY